LTIVVPYFVVQIGGVQPWVDVYGVAGEEVEIDSAGEQMKDATLVGEERLDPLEVCGGVAAVVFRLHPIVVSHDEDACNATVAAHEQRLRITGGMVVVLDPIGPGQVRQALRTTRFVGNAPLFP
jgi:hypothetical protein